MTSLSLPELASPVAYSPATAEASIRHIDRKLRRNDLCSCGSGLRYKRCCGQQLQATGVPSADLAALIKCGLSYLNRNLPDQAANCLQRAVALAPDNAEARYRLALAWELLGRIDDAICELQACAALDAKHAKALEGLGNLLIQVGRRSEAMTCYRQAALHQPASLAGRISHANVLIEEDRLSDAETWLRQTITEFPASGEAMRLLSYLLRQQGRFDEALPVLEAATHSIPSLAAAAYYDIVVSKTITAADDALLQRMRALLTDDTLPELFRARLHFALGKALDDLEMFQAAMEHFETANRLARRQPFDGADFISTVQNLINVFDADFLQACSGRGSPSEVPLFVLGMPRSGTTLVEHIISSHRKVAAGGEMNFWYSKISTMQGQLDNWLTDERIARVAEDYLSTLRLIGPDALRVTDKNGSNFLWIGLIRIVFPKARIIHCRRHPVDTCLSTYFTNFGETVPFTYSKADLVLYYQHYAKLMEHWRTILSPDYFHEVDYEQLVAEPEQVTRRLIEFCGLPWDDACLHPEANQRLVKTASLWQVRQPIFHSSVGRWRNYQPWLGELSQLLG